MFPSGPTWPADRDEREPEGPFGARLVVDPTSPEATSDPDLWRAGGLPAPGRVLEAWQAPSVVLDLRRRGESRRWRELLDRSRIRPIRPVFPYARRGDA